jgi:hypothetical protein
MGAILRKSILLLGRPVVESAPGSAEERLEVTGGRVVVDTIAALHRLRPAVDPARFEQVVDRQELRVCGERRLAAVGRVAVAERPDRQHLPDGGASSMQPVEPPSCRLPEGADGALSGQRTDRQEDAETTARRVGIGHGSG